MHTVSRVEDACRANAPGGKEDLAAFAVFAFANCQAAIAGRESAFAGERGREGGTGPMATLVRGEKQGEAAANRIPEKRSVSGVGEGQGVEESFGVGIGEEQSPGVPCVFCFVESGFRAFAAAHQNGAFSGEGVDAAKIKRFGAGDD